MVKTIVVAFEDPHLAEIKRIRKTVFTGEQHIDEVIDFDGQDQGALHSLAACEGRFVGTARMLSDGHIGRLAVLAEYRGRGLGAQLVSALVSEAERAGLRRVYLGSQAHAVGFYERLGFSVCGEPYTEASIRHVQMERTL